MEMVFLRGRCCQTSTPVETMNPLTIITVVRNHAAGLEKTFRSLAESSEGSYRPEIILIDGGSTDGTPEVVKKYNQLLSCWISEPDEGPYDAMNKGLRKATGEWVLFLNAGDLPAGPETLRKIFSIIETEREADLCYGDWMVDYSSFSTYRKAAGVQELWKGMICSHQSMIFRTRKLREAGFPAGYSLAADYYAVCSLHQAGCHFRYLPEPLAICESFGLSHRRMFRSAMEQYHIAKAFFPMTFGHRVFHFRRLLFFCVLSSVYPLIPHRLLSRILRKVHHDKII